MEFVCDRNSYILLSEMHRSTSPSHTYSNFVKETPGHILLTENRKHMQSTCTSQTHLKLLAPYLTWLQTSFAAPHIEMTTPPTLDKVYRLHSSISQVDTVVVC